MIVTLCFVVSLMAMPLREYLLKLKNGKSLNNPKKIQEQRPHLIGQRLISAGLGAAGQMSKKLPEIQAANGGRFGAALIRAGALSEENLLSVLSGTVGFALVGLDQIPEASVLAWLHERKRHYLRLVSDP